MTEIFRIVAVRAYTLLRSAQALLLKCYDSAEDGRARFTAHTAFDDLTSPPDAAPRESIETRALVFFAPEQEGNHTHR